jgi:hypothetical protein
MLETTKWDELFQEGRTILNTTAIITPKESKSRMR